MVLHPRCFDVPGHRGIGAAGDEVFSRSGLKEADPKKSPSDNVGKEIRVRAVLGHAARFPRAASGALVEDLLARMRVAGSFDPDSDQYGTDPVVRAAQRAFQSLGWILGLGRRLSPGCLETGQRFRTASRP